SVNDTYRMAVKAVDAKDYRKAISLLNDVIDQKPRHPDALNYLGYSHRKSGDYARAVTYYKKALSLDPEHRGANEYLGQAYVELGNLNAAVERLNALEKICGIDCDEYASLKISIDAAMALKAKQG
ncbi:MAG: tetratricopeptide repeat protein, partial [Alphaproteobacteria bacterium]